MGKFEVIQTKIRDLVLIKPRVFNDSRGFFLEVYNKREMADIGIYENFVQDNVSHSSKGVVRGLHFQGKHAQGKMVKVLRGKIFDVVVDIRSGSPTYGMQLGFELNSKYQCMIYVPVGFAHGFMALENSTDVMYKVTDYYEPASDAGIIWNDPDIGISWPLDAYGIQNPIISPKDAALPLLKDIITPFKYIN
jgi:dTDP-4-dehydrorhamnose 3,5-epimerase